MYSYETFPDQTILATCEEGYTFADLCDELAQNGIGMIVAGEELDSNDTLARKLDGLNCRQLLLRDL